MVRARLRLFVATRGAFLLPGCQPDDQVLQPSDDPSERHAVAHRLPALHSGHPVAAVGVPGNDALDGLRRGRHPTNAA